jgi:hypothetical protein
MPVRVLEHRNNRGVPRYIHLFLKDYLNAMEMNVTKKGVFDVLRIIRQDYPDLDLTKRKIQDYCHEYANRLNRQQIRDFIHKYPIS